MYNEHKIIKQYLAITKHVPEKPVGEINIPLIRREVKGVIRVLYKCA
jgi:23S rRNA-/tRNA-specific pseudouridylate synthase